MSLLPSLNRYRYFFLLKFLYLQNCTSGTLCPAAKRALVCQNFSASFLENTEKAMDSFIISELFSLFHNKNPKI